MLYESNKFKTFEIYIVFGFIRHKTELFVIKKLMPIIFVLLGGSLADEMTERAQQHRLMSEAELKHLLLQVADGLRYIHSQHLVHLDIKPGTYTSPLLS